MKAILGILIFGFLGFGIYIWITKSEPTLGTMGIGLAVGFLLGKSVD